MSVPDIRSEAVEQAELRSDRTRILALLTTLAALLVLVVFRAFTDEAWQALPRYLVLLVGMAAYEAVIYRAVTRAMSGEAKLPSWLWPVNFFVETLLPTVTLVLATNDPSMGPYRALSTPIVLVYFIFTILSTLRLSPQLSRLTGVFAATGYSAVVVYTYLAYPDLSQSPGVYPVQVYLTSAFLILLAGFVAGAVAGQIRNHVMVALQEARRIERLEHDLDIARSIQQGLLPKTPPDLAAFEIAGWNQPADQTGGDYFDWQELGDGRVAVVLADVSGHGIGPALITAVCRAYTRATLLWQHDISDVMSHMNRLLVEDLPSEKFVTFALGFLDPARSHVQLLSAGHGPLLVYRAVSGEVESLDAQGIPCGLMSSFSYGPPAEITLQEGDMLVLSTDGFFEWENSSREQFGLDRLKASIQDFHDLPAEEMIHRIYDRVLEFADGTNQDDDLTALVVKRKAE